MQDLLIFAAIILFVIAAVLVFGIGPRNLPSWAKSKAGQGALASMALGVGVVVVIGAVVAALVALVSALLPAAHAQTRPHVPKAYTAKSSWMDTRYGHFLNHVYVFAGVDYTRKLSPQCVAGSMQDRLTSNMGMGLNVWQSPSRKVWLDLQWTHHSCVLGVDRNSYDGFGMRATWFPWVR